jgi:hypothetical protein
MDNQDETRFHLLKPLAKNRDSRQSIIHENARASNKLAGRQQKQTNSPISLGPWRRIITIVEGPYLGA